MHAQVFEHMQEHRVEPDVVTCCSLVSALERGGQWRLAEQLFSQMCAAAAAAGDQRALLLLQRVGAGNVAGAQSQGLGVPLPPVVPVHG